jgi:predicted ATPase
MYARTSSLSCTILTLALDDTMPESHMSHISEHEISEHEPVSQLRQRRTRRIKAYCLDTDESVLSMTDEEPLVYEEEG